MSKDMLHRTHIFYKNGMQGITDGWVFKMCRMIGYTAHTFFAITLSKAWDTLMFSKTVCNDRLNRTRYFFNNHVQSIKHVCVFRTVCNDSPHRINTPLLQKQFGQYCTWFCVLTVCNICTLAMLFFSNYVCCYITHCLVLIGASW